MAAPTIKRPRWRPHDARVEWSHPLAHGLKSLVLPGALVDLVGLKRVTAFGNPAFVATPYGPGIKLDGTDDYLDIGKPMTTAGAWTLMAVFRLNSTLNGIGPAIIGVRYSPGNVSIAYSIEIAFTDTASPSTVQGGIFSWVPSLHWDLVTGPALTVGRWYNIACTYTGGDSGALALYYDGLRVGTGAGTGTNPVPIENTVIGRRHATEGTEYLPGDVAVTGVWDRALTANEVAALYADPFCMLRS